MSWLQIALQSLQAVIAAAPILHVVGSTTDILQAARTLLIGLAAAGFAGGPNPVVVGAGSYFLFRCLRLQTQHALIEHSRRENPTSIDAERFSAHISSIIAHINQSGSLDNLPSELRGALKAIQRYMED